MSLGVRRRTWQSPGMLPAIFTRRSGTVAAEYFELAIKDIRRAQWSAEYAEERVAAHYAVADRPRDAVGLLATEGVTIVPRSWPEWAPEAPLTMAILRMLNAARAITVSGSDARTSRASVQTSSVSKLSLR